MEKDLEQAIIKQKYDFYNANRKNHSDSANKIMEQILLGYSPNEADIFELYAEEKNQDKIEIYRKTYNLKQKIKEKGTISSEELEYLLDMVAFDDDTKKHLKNSFMQKGLITNNIGKAK